jgi:imidazolonepropionase-like amidohydrolase
MHPATDRRSPPVELVIRDARLLCCFDDADTELPGGWLAVDGGVITALGAAGTPPPEARNVVDASGCVVLPGLVNAHQHLYQNLTRAYVPAEQVENLTDWFWTYFTAWSRLEADAVAAATTVRARRTRHERVHDQRRPSVPAPRARAHRQFDPRGRRGGVAVSPGPRIDDAG